jgi:hypothetical protein
MAPLTASRDRHWRLRGIGRRSWNASPPKARRLLPRARPRRAPGVRDRACGEAQRHRRADRPGPQAFRRPRRWSTSGCWSAALVDTTDEERERQQAVNVRSVPRPRAAIPVMIAGGGGRSSISVRSAARRRISAWRLTTPPRPPYLLTKSIAIDHGPQGHTATRSVR